jgi:hypothetical protein
VRIIAKVVGHVVCIFLLFAAVPPCRGQNLIIGIGRNQPHAHNESTGSVAVAVVREDTIVVAAESRTSTNGLLNPDTTCKITIVNNVVFAATGLLYGSKSSEGIMDFGRHILQGPGKTSEKLKAFQAGASSLLASWLNVPDLRDSLAGSPHYGYRRSIHAIFCFFAGHSPVVVKYVFTPAGNGKQMTVGGTYDAGARKPGEIIWIGTMEQTDSLLRSDTIFAERIRTSDAIVSGKLLLEKQMSLTPKIVGGEIDLAVVTSRGARWVIRKQQCY